jgi:hypothetical protein
MTGFLLGGFPANHQVEVVDSLSIHLVLCPYVRGMPSMTHSPSRRILCCVVPAIKVQHIGRVTIGGSDLHADHATIAVISALHPARQQLGSTFRPGYSQGREVAGQAGMYTAGQLPHGAEHRCLACISESAVSISLPGGISMLHFARPASHLTR